MIGGIAHTIMSTSATFENPHMLESGIAHTTVSPPNPPSPKLNNLNLLKLVRTWKLPSVHTIGNFNFNIWQLKTKSNKPLNHK